MLQLDQDGTASKGGGPEASGMGYEGEEYHRYVAIRKPVHE